MIKKFPNITQDIIYTPNFRKIHIKRPINYSDFLSHISVSSVSASSTILLENCLLEN